MDVELLIQHPFSVFLEHTPHILFIQFKWTLQRYDAVEYKGIRFGILTVDAEETVADKLIAVS